MVAVHQDLGLHDRHQPLLLHGAGVAGQSPGVLTHTELRRGAIGADAQDRPPLGETGAARVIAGCPLPQSLEAGAPALAGQAPREGLHPLIHLDAHHQALVPEALENRSSRQTTHCSGFLKEGFLVEDHPTDRRSQPRGGGQQSAVGATVFLTVLQADRREALADRAGGFIRGQQATAGAGKGGGGGLQLLAMGLERHGILQGLLHG